MQRTEPADVAALRYDVVRMQDDMDRLGLQPVDVARKCRPPVAKSTVSRFLSGRHQTARMAKRIARVLKQDVDHYMTSRAVPPNTGAAPSSDVEDDPRSADQRLAERRPENA